MVQIFYDNISKKCEVKLSEEVKIFFGIIFENMNGMIIMEHCGTDVEMFYDGRLRRYKFHFQLD